MNRTPCLVFCALLAASCSANVSSPSAAGHAGTGGSSSAGGIGGTGGTGGRSTTPASAASTFPTPARAGVRADRGRELRPAELRARSPARDRPSVAGPFDVDAQHLERRLTRWATLVDGGQAGAAADAGRDLLGLQAVPRRQGVRRHARREHRARAEQRRRRSRPQLDGIKVVAELVRQPRPLGRNAGRARAATDGRLPGVASSDKQKYILLATDGQPTCAGGDPLLGGGDPDTDDFPSGPAAVAEVAAMGIKVPVVGIAFSKTWDPTNLKAQRDHVERHGEGGRHAAADGSRVLRRQLVGRARGGVRPDHRDRHQLHVRPQGDEAAVAGRRGREDRRRQGAARQGARRGLGLRRRHGERRHLRSGVRPAQGRGRDAATSRSSSAAPASSSSSGRGGRRVAAVVAAASLRAAAEVRGGLGQGWIVQRRSAAGRAPGALRRGRRRRARAGRDPAARFRRAVRAGRGTRSSPARGAPRRAIARASPSPPARRGRRDRRSARCRRSGRRARSRGVGRPGARELADRGSAQPAWCSASAVRELVRDRRRAGRRRSSS